MVSDMFIKKIGEKDYTPNDNLAFASMQAELTNYWDQAYHSSRFCDYFLPEYWNNPFSKEGEDNKYLFNIPNVDAETVESDINAETVKLDETYIPHALITDAGLTEFHGVPTNTCLGIGPYIAEEIDKFTGNLPLL